MYFFLSFSDKKDKKKEDATPTVLKGVYVFPNGDRYGRHMDYSIPARI